MQNTNTYVSARGDIALACDTYRSLSVLATGVAVKAAPGVVYAYFLYNGSAAARFIKLYNKATAPTVGTDVPLVTIPLPAASAANVYLGPGIAFSAGIGIAATQLVADADTTAPAANDVVANILYK